ncbi:MAG TPA: arsenate reductase (glutaredoxin) [Ensifer sp.]|nr:arsenate reductase (glutaredoxin) [Ensifer sp.]
MNVTILHNPRCSTSRAVLEMIRQAGHEPSVVEYLKNPPERAELVRMLMALEMNPRQLMRRKEPIYAELNLDDPSLTDNDLVDAMLANPILIERPIVISEKGIRLGRPKERVEEIL